GAGDFQFTRPFTQRLPAFSDSSSGNAIASLLLGDPSGGIIQNTPILAYRWGYYGFYFQDDLKVSRKLTLNVGVRYDIEGSPTERYDRMNRGFSAAPSPLAGAVRNANPSDCPACSNLIGGLQFVTGSNRQAFNTEYSHMQPRFGAAYALSSRTVVRGGIGVFYLPEAAYGGSAGFSADTPFVSTIGGGVNGFIPATTLSNPFPNGLVQPTGSSLGAATFLGNNIIFSNPNRSIPHTVQYSFGVQHQLPGNVRVDASYVGSRTYDINTNDNQAGSARNLNVNTPDQLAQARQNSSFFNQAVPNPFAGLLPNNPGFNGATVPRQRLLLPFPQFGQVLEAQESVGKIWYDSLQVNVEKRYSADLVLVAAYTFSKNLESVQYLNDQDPKTSKALTSQDRPQRLVLSGVYGLPFGKGKRFLTGVNRGWEQLVGGWEYNFIGTLQSGTPFNYLGNVDLIGNPQTGDANFNSYFNGCVQQLNGTALAPDPARNGKFVTCTNPAWAIRGPNTLRTIPFRSGQLRNPWAKQWDMSLNKRFNFTERWNAQFRLEAFNVFNTPILGAPNNNPTDPNFGFVTRNQSNFPRQVQLGFKLNF
ncbi:MAG: TonB-dependent receptor, partial [Acidobacteriota bacterium]|nr:TonB-dependent receptor [Acidobacteriota bacterium]